MSHQHVRHGNDVNGLALYESQFAQSPNGVLANTPQALNHSNSDAEAEYDRLRDLARQEAAKRSSCFDRAHQAYESGDGARAVAAAGSSATGCASRRPTTARMRLVAPGPVTPCRPGAHVTRHAAVRAVR